MTDVYTDPEQLRAEIATLNVNEDLYLQVDAADPSKQTLEPVLPIRRRASKLIQTFKFEDLYLRPSDTGAGKEWYDIEAKQHKFYDEKWYYGNISREKAERLVLDQEKGTFLVRVSIKKKKKNYAITVAMGDSNFLHISITLIDSGEVTIDKVNYKGLRAAIDHFSSNPYKDIITLIGPVAVMAAPPKLPAARPAPAFAGTPPLVPERTAPEPPPRSEPTTPLADPGEDENLYMVPVKLDFTSEHIYCSTISSDEDDVYERPDYEEPDEFDMYKDGQEGDDDTYLAPSKVMKPEVPLPARRKTIKQLALPLQITEWTSAEVQRFLKESGLTAFKNPFYANGVTGVELVGCKGADFPKTRFSKAQCDAFDAALDAVKAKESSGNKVNHGDGTLSRTMSGGPPPVLGRPSRK